MIYSRFGCELKIVNYCGKHQKPGYGAGLVLVKALRQDDGAECYYFAHTLRADGGINAIDKAIDDAPEINLTASELEKAIKQAE
jgi:hypothetical protein